MLKTTNEHDSLAHFKHQLATPLTNLWFTLNNLSPSQLKTQALDQFLQLNRFFHDRESRERPAKVFTPCRTINHLLDTYQKPYQLKCHFTLTTKIPKKIYGREDHFNEIVTHLLNNAAESYHQNCYARPIAISLVEAGSGLNLIVGDNGCGMNKLQQFLVVNHQHSFKKIKSGLGLARVQHLLRAEFAGKLIIFSHRGKGTITIAHFPWR